MRSLHFYTQVLTILILDFRKIIIFLGRNVTTVLAQIKLLALCIWTHHKSDYLRHNKVFVASKKVPGHGHCKCRDFGLKKYALHKIGHF